VRKHVVYQLRRTVAVLVCVFASIVSCVCPTYAGNIPPALPVLNTVRVGHFPIALVVDERLARVFVVNDVTTLMERLACLMRCMELCCAQFPLSRTKI